MPNLIPKEELPPFDLEEMPNPEQSVVSQNAAENGEPVATDTGDDTTPDPTDTTSQPDPVEEGDMEDELKKLSEKPAENKSNLLSGNPKEEVKPEEKNEAKDETKPDSQSENSERDNDLPAPENDPHIRPKFAKDFKAIKSKVVEARNALDVERKAKADLEARIRQLEEAAKKPAELPKDVAEKLSNYEQRIRELDISKSPEIQSKYDAKVESNNKAIIETLQKFGFGKDEDGKDDPAAVKQLKEAGMSFRTLKPYIDKLNESGLTDEAETISEFIRDNIRTAKAKDSEIAQWKSSYEAKAQERQQQAQAQQQTFQQEIAKHQDRLLNADLEEISKVFPNAKRPADPLATDTPAIAAAKKQAQQEYDTMRAGIEDGLKAFNATGLPPEKAAEVHAKVGVAAIKSLLFQNYVVPKLHADLQAQMNRVKELEGELGKVRKAGSISKAHSAAIQTKGADKPLPEDMGEALAELAKGMGIPTN